MYYPDFFIHKLNIIIEIKSSYTYDIDLSKNLDKMNACFNLDYKFIFIIDKNYNDFIKMYNLLSDIKSK